MNRRSKHQTEEFKAEAVELQSTFETHTDFSTRHKRYYQSVLGNRRLWC